ncbi:TPA: hypothetical protein SIA39_003947 [Aeromonas sobria]|nr:hypothetical protein [Aeromonas sobria]
MDFVTLKSVPPEAWAGLAGVLIGAILSIFGTWLSNTASLKQLKIQLQFNQEQVNSELNRNRLEELYTGINEWANVITGHYLTLMMVMDEKLTYNQYLDKTIEDDKTRSYDFGRLEMIIKVYGSAFEDIYEEVLAARTSLNSISSNFRESYISGEPVASSFIKPYIASQKIFESKTKELLDKIAACAKNA